MNIEDAAKVVERSFVNWRPCQLQDVYEVSVRCNLDGEIDGSSVYFNIESYEGQTSIARVKDNELAEFYPLASDQMVAQFLKDKKKIKKGTHPYCSFSIESEKLLQLYYVPAKSKYDIERIEADGRQVRSYKMISSLDEAAEYKHVWQKNKPYNMYVYYDNDKPVSLLLFYNYLSKDAYKKVIKECFS